MKGLCLHQRNNNIFKQKRSGFKSHKWKMPGVIEEINFHNKGAQRPDGKPGRELALWVEGFFRLDLLLPFGSSQK